MRNGCEMKEWNCVFAFLPSLLECCHDPQKVESCVTLHPMEAGFAAALETSLLLQGEQCWACCQWEVFAVIAFVWIMGSVLPYAWLLGRAHVQILGITLPLSRAVQECRRSWQLYRCAGIPTVVWTASQGSAGHLWKAECPCQVSGNTHILHWSEQVTTSSHIFSKPILAKSGEQNSVMRCVCLTWHTTLLAIGWTGNVVQTKHNFFCFWILNVIVCIYYLNINCAIIYTSIQNMSMHISLYLLSH